MSASPDVDPGVLFVLGAPRSGTTLVYRCLALHPQAAWINQYCRRLPVAPELAVLNRWTRHVADSRQRAWFGAEGDAAYRYGVRRSWGERFFPQPVEGEPLFEHRGVLPGLASQPIAHRQARLRSDFRRLARACGADVVVSKRIGHNRRIALLAEIFPQAKFVVVTRDGRAVTRSLLRVDWWPTHHVWWFDGTPDDWSRQGRDPVELAAWHWVREVEAIDHGLAGLSEERVHRVSYEDVVSHPDSTLGEVARFAGLGDEPTWHQHLAEVRFPDRNGVPDDVDDDVDDRVTCLQARALASLGYLR